MRKVVPCCDSVSETLRTDVVNAVNAVDAVNAVNAVNASYPRLVATSLVSFS